MDSIAPDIEFKSNDTKDPGFEILELESLYQREATGELTYIGAPHRIHFYGILIIEKGSGSHTVDFSSLPVTERSVVIINKGQVHAFDLTHKPVGKLIVFTEQYLNTIAADIAGRIFAPTYLTFQHHPSFNLAINSYHAVSHLLALINFETTSPKINSSYLKLLFTAFLLKINDSRPVIYHPSIKPHQIRKFEGFISLLQQHYQAHRDAESYAQHLGTTYKTLNTICKRITQRSPKQLIDAFVILEAKRLFTIEQRQVQEVSELLGFEEVSNFVKYFKKHTLLTPTQFKKQKWNC